MPLHPRGVLWFTQDVLPFLGVLPHIDRVYAKEGRTPRIQVGLRDYNLIDVSRSGWGLKSRNQGLASGLVET